MKRFIISLLALTLLAGTVILPVSAADKQTETISYTYDAGRWSTYTREMEKLDRGLAAINTGNSVYLSWRLFDSEDYRFGSADSNVSFNVYRGSTKIATIEDSTNYTDGTIGASYSVAPVVNGVEGEKCAAVSVQNGNYFDIPIQKPQAATLADNSTAEYTANDASCGDIDGDGEYEIVLKWDANGKDNSQSGYTGNVLLDAYKLDGTKLWRIDLGQNVRAGAHYTQFLVYDFDLDGEAEMMCQTAPGSKDSAGNYVTKASHVDDIKSISDADNQNSYINDGGYNLTSDEFLTVFESDGTAADTIYYPNQRIDASVWGDGYGNRCDRFTATVAYMDGVKPYGVYMRGYYFGQSGYGQRQAACAVSYDGSVLSCTHSFDTYNPSSYRYKTSSASYANGVYKGVDGYKAEYAKFVGNGNHNCAVADMDGDGKDEVTTGSLCYEFKEDGTLAPKWCTFLEHGDALHIGDYDPTHEGFEFFTVHEDGDKNNADEGYSYTNSQGVRCSFGMSVIDPGVDCTDPTSDAYNDLIIFHEGANDDTGRGVMANIGMGGYYQIWSAKNGLYTANGGTSFTAGSKSGLSQNFRIFWDGDLYDELLDGTNITKYDPDGGSWWSPVSTLLTADGCVQINGTKANPALQADLFGDWREEVVYPTSDNTKLRVYTSTTPTDYKIKTLMQDPVYRSGVAAEQTAYNQPPHIGLYLADEVFEAKVTGIAVTALPTKTKYVIGESLDPTGLVVTAMRDDGTSSPTTLYTLSELDSSTPGEKTITVTCDGFTDTFTVTVLSVNSISVTPPNKTTYSVGQSLSTTGMTVRATYSNGQSGDVPLSECEITGFDSSELGECTVTVSYQGKQATFKVNIVEGRITLINGTYETSSSEEDNFDIGSYKDSFTLEHTVTINQLPADGDSNKSSTSGFFFRINPATGTGTGAGWYFTASGSNAANVYWKSGATRNNATKINNTPLSVGQSYTFRYSFSEVGTGNGAKVTLTILDLNGNAVGSVSDLNLRNLTNDDQKVYPVGSIQIYNNANANSTASVTIDNARIYDTGIIYSTVSNRVFYSLNGVGNGRMFAAKYSGGRLTNIAEVPLTALGDEILSDDIGFDPDKVFMWTYDMYPITVWEKEN